MAYKQVMAHRSFRTLGLIAPLIVLGSGVAGCAPAAARSTAVYYVDFTHGNDDASGLTPATSWRHAPGDPQAGGKPAQTKLGPGDTVAFAAGVRYRGEIRVNGSGTPEAPITFTSQPGDRAIIDGSDVVDFAPCRSAAECGGVSAWRGSVRITFKTPATINSALFTEQGALFPGQAPNVEDIFYSDDTQFYLEASGTDLSAGRARLPKQTAAQLQATAGGSLALWVYGNQVVVRPITGIEGDAARFDPTGLRFYDDRPGRFAVLGRPDLVDRPGEFALLENGMAAVATLPTGSTRVSVARGRGGIDLNGASNIVVRGLSFENMADDGASIRTGVAIGNFARPVSGVTIEKNNFANFRMPKGQGPVTIRYGSNLVIKGNAIQGVALGSGIRLSRGADVTIAENEIRRVGRTGVMLMDVKGATVSGNVIRDVKGVHGNGMSVYLANENIRVVSNTVFEAYRPMTFHGSGKTGAVDNNIEISNNLFVAEPRSSAALSSWGNTTRGVRIEDNILLGGKVGILLSKEDQDVTVQDNLINGIAFKGEYPAGWKVGGNREVVFKPTPGLAKSGLERTMHEVAAGSPTPERLKEVCDLVARTWSGQDAKGTIGAKARCRAGSD